MNVYRSVNSAEDISSLPVRLVPGFCSALPYDVSAVTAAMLLIQTVNVHSYLLRWQYIDCSKIVSTLCGVLQCISRMVQIFLGVIFCASVALVDAIYFLILIMYILNNQVYCLGTTVFCGLQLLEVSRRVPWFFLGNFDKAYVTGSLAFVSKHTSVASLLCRFCQSILCHSLRPYCSVFCVYFVCFCFILQSCRIIVSTVGWT